MRYQFDWTEKQQFQMSCRILELFRYINYPSNQLLHFDTLLSVCKAMPILFTADRQGTHLMVRNHKHSENVH